MAILDSGNRTEFATGAVRDMREGKGRMDLIPLEVMANILHDGGVIGEIAEFKTYNDTNALYNALIHFVHDAYGGSEETMLLEVGKHFEEGAKKYGENNWQKGIEPKYYIDSAIRHYLKWRRGDKDEPHDRAFVWNIMCCIWEVDWHEKEKSDTQKVEENIVAAVKEINRSLPSAEEVMTCDADVTGETLRPCKVCRYEVKSALSYPCNECDGVNHFKPKED